jgi:CRISPR/Cas system CMR subunit Cmr6 (Cas7 group RAMP superfamily)
VVNKRKQFSINQKMNILKETDSGEKQAATVKELRIAPTKVSTIQKYLEKIVKLYERSALCPIGNVCPWEAMRQHRRR